MRADTEEGGRAWRLADCHKGTGPSKDWGSSSHGHIGNGIDFSFEELSEGGAELAVEGGATDLEQEIGAAA